MKKETFTKIFLKQADIAISDVTMKEYMSTFCLLYTSDAADE